LPGAPAGRSSPSKQPERKAMSTNTNNSHNTDKKVKTGKTAPNTPVPKFGDFDLPHLEREILLWWEKEQVFAQLRQQNSKGPTFSFLDGPITANNPRGIGVHHAWGRTYKDVFQRHRAMQGYQQRYHNGYDAQGLWVEVEVEKDLRLDSKQQIVSYGLERFARACRTRVQNSARAIEATSRRLGQWMDWEHSYYTHSDNNIEHIWHFLQRCHQNGWLYQDQRVLPWCRRCGTSLSQHELSDAHADTTHKAVFCTMPLLQRPGAALLVWTTTPWTLPANSALAVHPDLEYVSLRLPIKQAPTPKHHALNNHPQTLYLAAAAAQRLFPDTPVEHRFKGAALVGLGYEGPFDDLPVQRQVKRRVVAWTEVEANTGSGVVHIAPGCGAEDFGLGREQNLALLDPINAEGLYNEGYGFLSGRPAWQAADIVCDALQDKGFLHQASDFTHRYPHCWRCKTELVFRPAVEWFIACDPIRPRLMAAAESIVWQPPHAGAQMQDWLHRMGDWCISRQRYWGLPLPFYQSEDGELVVVGSRDELRQKAADPALVDALPELHRPWIDAVELRLPDGRRAQRVAAVGDCWLDAGIAPFSTMGYLTDPDHWRRWFPADFATEMREQVRLWFYAALFTGVVLEDKAPFKRILTYEKMRDGQGQAMHKSAGNALWFDEQAELLGADSMRWLFAAHNPALDLNFSPPALQKAQRLFMTWWNVCRFFSGYADLDGFSPAPNPLLPKCQDSATTAATNIPLSPLDRWLLSRLQVLVTDVGTGLERFELPPLVRQVESFFDDLSNWYVRSSRRRFWRSDTALEKTEQDNTAQGTTAQDTTAQDKQAAYSTLYTALSTLCRLLAPLLPFLCEAIYQRLVRPADPQAPSSVHLCPYPQSDPEWVDEELNTSMATIRSLAALGRAARATAGLKVRQPLRQIQFYTGDNKGENNPTERIAALTELLCHELNVQRAVPVSDPKDFYTPTLKLDFRRAGKRLGKQVQAVAQALSGLEAKTAIHSLKNQGFLVLEIDGEKVELDEAEVRIGQEPRPGLAVAEDQGLVLALDTHLDTELRDEGRARELVHRIQLRRKEIGLAMTDRIRLVYSGGPLLHRVLEHHRDYICTETLCIDVQPSDEHTNKTFALDFTLEGERIGLNLETA
jgi:isoleucyl-tRNA synthetase